MNRSDIDKGGSYCRPCYKAWRDDTRLKESAVERKRKCSSTRLGYYGCGEQVCDKCWESYNHKP